MVLIGEVFKRSFTSTLFVYSTVKVVDIRSKSVGLINRFIQLAILLYILVYAVIISRGYQKQDIGIASTTSKVKGVTKTNISDPRVGKRVWDAIDLVVPPEENNAFFVTTNVIVTDNQTLSVCTETAKESACKSDTDCRPVGKPYLLGHGVTTGICDTKVNRCQVEAWCPIENDHPATNYAVLSGTQNFTVLLKSHVYFPIFQKSQSNMVSSRNTVYIKNCNYNKDRDPFCPIFKLGDIVSSATSANGATFSYDDIANLGGVIGISIKWRCDFDYSSERCKPEYTFTRVDRSEDSDIAPGYNFRYADHYFDEKGEQHRQQIKAYGILFIISVDAIGYQTDVRTLITTLGSGFALLVLATIVCDVIIIYIHKYKDVYKEVKYQNIDTTGAFMPLADQNNRQDYDAVS